MCKCGGEMVNYLLVLCLIASELWDGPLILRFLVFNELCLKKWLRCIPFEEVLLVGIEAVVFGKWPHFALCRLLRRILPIFIIINGDFLFLQIWQRLQSF